MEEKSENKNSQDDQTIDLGGLKITFNSPPSKFKKNLMNGIALALLSASSFFGGSIIHQPPTPPTQSTTHGTPITQREQHLITIMDWYRQDPKFINQELLGERKKEVEQWIQDDGNLLDLLRNVSLNVPGLIAFIPSDE